MLFVLPTNNILKLEELRGSKLFKKDVPCTHTLHTLHGRVYNFFNVCLTKLSASAALHDIELWLHAKCCLATETQSYNNRARSQKG